MVKIFKEQREKPKVFIKLRETKNGVYIIAVKEDGIEFGGGSIIGEITEKGLELWAGISEIVPIEKNGSGVIKTKIYG